MDSEASNNDALAQEKELLASVADKGAGEKVKTYAKLCGPGWLQSAITLGGGSLVGALGLGVIGGTGFMWVQPVAMILGVILLSAIAYVTLSHWRAPVPGDQQPRQPRPGVGVADRDDAGQHDLVPAAVQPRLRCGHLKLGTRAG